MPTTALASPRRSLGWAQRHFVRPESYETADAWAQLFADVSGAPDRWLNALVPDAELRRRFADTLSRLFTQPIDRANAVEVQLEAQEKAPVEASLFACDPPTGALAEFPVVPMAFETVARELVLRTWHQLEASLSSDEIESVVRRARELAPQLHINPELMRDPVE